MGQTLEIRFGVAEEIDTVGLIPGFAKTDPSDGTDRYAQDRRIAAVQYTFDDGTTAVQRFDTDPGNRSLQSMPVPLVRTARIDITILESVPGAPVNGQPAVDKVAVAADTVAGAGIEAGGCGGRDRASTEGASSFCAFSCCC